MDSSDEVTVVERSPVAVEVWLAGECPRALRWYRLWLVDRSALRLVREAADSLGLSEARANRLVEEHASAERSASLWYLSELMACRARTELALEAHDVRVSTVERLTARLARIDELSSEVSRATEKQP